MDGFINTLKLLPLLLVLSVDCFGEDLFVIRPYMIVGEDNRLSLIFKTVKDVTLSLKVKFSPAGSQDPFSASKTFKAHELNKFEIGSFRCGSALSYEVTDQTEAPLVRNETFSYPCAKEKKKAYFAFMSDTQIKDGASQERANVLSDMTAELRRTYPFSFVLNAGDIVHNGGRESEWVNFFKTADTYLRSSYLLSAVGNHEYYESESQDKAPVEFFDYMRDQASSDLGTAVTEFEQFSLVVLNSNFKFLSEARIKEQWAWLEDKLRKNQSLGKPVLISMHHSPFSSSLEWFREIPTRLRSELVPLIEKYSCVKLVLTGHLHLYERSEKAGIRYLIAGPSGGMLSPVSYVNPHMVYRHSFVTTLSVFEVVEDRLTVRTFDSGKTLIDTFTVPLLVR